MNPSTSEACPTKAADMATLCPAELMRMMVTAFALCLLFVGWTLWMGHQLLTQQIVDAIRDRQDGLTTTEAWLNVYAQKKRQKLLKLATEHPDEDLRNKVRRALRLETIGVFLFIVGAALLLLVSQFGRE